MGEWGTLAAARSAGVGDGDSRVKSAAHTQLAFGLQVSAVEFYGLAGDREAQASAADLAAAGGVGAIKAFKDVRQDARRDTLARVADADQQGVL